MTLKSEASEAHSFPRLVQEMEEVGLATESLRGFMSLSDLVAYCVDIVPATCYEQPICVQEPNMCIKSPAEITGILHCIWQIIRNFHD